MLKIAYKVCWQGSGGFRQIPHPSFETGMGAGTAYRALFKVKHCPTMLKCTKNQFKGVFMSDSIKATPP